MRKSHHSLHGLLRQSLLRSVICMILPVCVLAGLLVVLTQRYGADIALTTRASEVRTVLVQDLPDEVWNVVSGRISFEDGRQRMLIDSALWELNDMLDSAGEDEAQYLNAALRAIRTIDSYVDQLETQMDAGAAVSRNESLYREIHSVGHLAGSMLDRYIENEIARMGRFNACIQHGLGAAALALIALVGVMIWLTIRASDNLQGAIGASLRQLEQFANRGYDVLDKIRALDPSVSLSLSIGIGRGARTLREAQDMAEHALDMAQGRGGDQAAEMTLDGFTFYGGVSHGVEKRSKVRSRLVADQLVKLIKEADHVVIMGHRMSDLDAIGAAEGVLRICKICDVPAVIAVRRDATLAASLIDALCKAGQKDDFIDPKDALPIISKRTLCIVVDTYQVGLVESKDILEKCGKVAVIDHHRKGVGYIENPALVCHEPYSSSASELVTELLQYVGERDDKPNRIEAEGLLAGILLDTQDFTLHTGVRTFEAAAALRRYGAETERVRRLFDVTMVEYNAKADLVEKAQMYKNCAISIGGEVAPEARVAIAQAANDLLRIQGVYASFVAVQVGNGVNVSARSMGAVNVQVIMESLGGGGHQTMAAAQLKHITPQAARSRIQDAIDQYYLSQKKTTPEARPAKGE